MGRHNVDDRVVVGDATHGDDGVARVGGDGETKERGVAGREFYEERRLGVRLERFRGEIILGDDRRVVDKCDDDDDDDGAGTTNAATSAPSASGDESPACDPPRLAAMKDFQSRATVARPRTAVVRARTCDADSRPTFARDRPRPETRARRGGRRRRIARRRSAGGVLSVHQTMDVIVRHARLGQFILFDETHE